MKEIQPITTRELWNRVPRILFFIAHPDDENLWARELIRKARREGVYARILRATRGEKGQLWGDDYPPEIVMAVRDKEYLRSARNLRVGGDTLRPAFPDGELPQHQEALNHAFVNYIRQENFGGVVAISPTERFTWQIAHEDHPATGLAALMTQYSDNPKMYNEAGAKVPNFRPALTFWTTNEHDAKWSQMRQLHLTSRDMVRRLRSFQTYYGSQFSDHIMEWWKGVLEEISRDDETGTFRHLFVRVR